MATSGVLLLVDAGLALLWQEPVSALIAWRQQAALESRLAPPPAILGSSGPPLPALAAAHARATRAGDPLGRIVLPSLEDSYVVVEGTDRDALRKGPGHYPDTPLPGQRGTVAVAGHRTTYLAPFSSIDRLRRGDDIELAMPYGRFAYRVEQTRIVDPRAVWVKRRTDHDRLILSACHPRYSAAQRIVVFARLWRPPLPRPGGAPIAARPRAQASATPSRS